SAIASLRMPMACIISCVKVSTAAAVKTFEYVGRWFSNVSIARQTLGDRLIQCGKRGDPEGRGRIEVVARPSANRRPVLVAPASNINRLRRPDKLRQSVRGVGKPRVFDAGPDE